MLVIKTKNQAMKVTSAIQSMKYCSRTLPMILSTVHTTVVLKQCYKCLKKVSCLMSENCVQCAKKNAAATLLLLKYFQIFLELKH